MAEIMSCLAPAARQEKPMNVWLHGRPGTGKTAVVKFLLERLSREHNVMGSYINCWEHDTLYSVLDALVSDLRILRAEQQSTSFKLERVRKTIGDSPFILVLDEIDRPSPKDRQDMIYCLSRLGKVGLVCIANSQDTYFALDERIKSRLNPKPVEFSSYSEVDLLEILRSRAEDGLSSSAWSSSSLRRIAQLAKGDARLAIQTLKNAAEAVESESALRVTPAYVEKGWHNAMEVGKSWLLRGLTEDHRLLYRLISRRKEMLSGDLWQFYLDHCASNGRQPIALRTFSDYVNDLRKAKLVEIERARVRGKVRLLRVVR